MTNISSGTLSLSLRVCLTHFYLSNEILTILFDLILTPTRKSISHIYKPVYLVYKVDLVHIYNNVILIFVIRELWLIIYVFLILCFVDAAVFDMEYARWIDDHHRLMCELRAAVQEHLPENELRLFVDTCLAHYDEVMNLKSMVAKSDVFHLFSGAWKTPAERCFMWIGGFRPSEMIKVLINIQTLILNWLIFILFSTH